jgi:hypothetical protein
MLGRFWTRGAAIGDEPVPLALRKNFYQEFVFSQTNAYTSIHRDGRIRESCSCTQGTALFQTDVIV